MDTFMVSVSEPIIYRLSCDGDVASGGKFFWVASGYLEMDIWAMTSSQISNMIE